MFLARPKSAESLRRPSRFAAVRRTGSRKTAVLLAGALALSGLAAVSGSAALAAPGAPFVQGVTFPFNGVWLESTDGGHYWDASGNGLCRIDADAAAPGGFSENAGTCDVQAKKPTQAVVGARNADGTYFVYSADMSSQSGGPVRLTYNPAADSGRGAIVANSGFVLGGLNTVGFFADAGGNFKQLVRRAGPVRRQRGVQAGDPGRSDAAVRGVVSRVRAVEEDRADQLRGPAELDPVDRDDLDDRGPAQGRPVRHRRLPQRQRHRRPLHRRARRARGHQADGHRALRAVGGLA